MQIGSLVKSLIDHWVVVETKEDQPFAPTRSMICEVEEVVVKSGKQFLVLVEFPGIDPTDGERYCYEISAFVELQQPMAIPETLFNHQPEKEIV